LGAGAVEFKLVDGQATATSPELDARVDVASRHSAAPHQAYEAAAAVSWQAFLFAPNQ
jgi:hypothetical protein